MSYSIPNYIIYFLSQDPVDSLPAKLLKGWMKARENSLDMDSESVIGSIVPLKVDVTKEDVLREATEKMGAHLNAGERGILAVVNTAGSIFRGRMDSQEVWSFANLRANGKINGYCYF